MRQMNASIRGVYAPWAPGATHTSSAGASRPLFLKRPPHRGSHLKVFDGVVCQHLVRGIYGNRRRRKVVFRERRHEVILRERIQVVRRGPDVRDTYGSLVIEARGVKNSTCRVLVFPVHFLSKGVIRPSGTQASLRPTSRAVVEGLRNARRLQRATLRPTT